MVRTASAVGARVVAVVLVRVLDVTVFRTATIGGSVVSGAAVKAEEKMGASVGVCVASAEG
jgi:hypothetical protein